MNQFEKIEQKQAVIEKDVKQLLEVLKVEEAKKKGKKAIVPKKISRQVKKGMEAGKIAVAYFGENHQFKWTTGRIENGLIVVGEESYSLDSLAIYYDHKNKMPVCGVYGWRMSPVGSDIDKYHSRLIGGENDKDLADQFNIGNAAKKTIIRMIKREETIDQDNKPKKKLNWVWIIVIAGVAIYLLTQIL